MDELIEALQIFRKYFDDERCFTCEHDIFIIHLPKKVSKEDKKRLGELGVYWDKEESWWYSFRFGSC